MIIKLVTYKSKKISLWRSIRSNDRLYTHYMEGVVGVEILGSYFYPIQTV